MTFGFDPIGNHQPVAAKVISKIDRGRPATSVHGFVLTVFRARARSIMRLYHSITSTMGSCGRVRPDQGCITDPSRRQRLGEEFSLHFRQQRAKPS
jgi:hypothetical protein